MPRSGNYFENSARKIGKFNTLCLSNNIGAEGKFFEVFDEVCTKNFGRKLWIFQSFSRLLGYPLIRGKMAVCKFFFYIARSAEKRDFRVVPCIFSVTINYIQNYVLNSCFASNLSQKIWILSSRSMKIVKSSHNWREARKNFWNFGHRNVKIDEFRPDRR